MANTMSTGCLRKKWIQIILKQFLTSLLVFLTSNITIIVDVRHGTWITTTSLHMLHCNCCYGKQEVHPLVHKEMTNKQYLSPALHFAGDYGGY